MTRHEHLMKAVRDLLRAGQPINAETIATRVSPDIVRDMSDDEITLAYAQVENITLSSGRAPETEPVEPTSEVARDPFGRVYAVQPKNFGAPRANASASSSNPPTNSITQPQAVAEVKAAQRAVAECRNQVRVATQELQKARGVLFDRIQAYQAGGESFTPLNASRAFCAAGVAERKARAAARVAVGLKPTPDTAPAFVRRRMKYGPQRGGLNEEQRARVGFAVPGSPAATKPDTTKFTLAAATSKGQGQQ